VNGTTNKPTDKPTTTDGSAEQPEPKKELTEEERWAPDRTGWAPRFQVPEDEMEAGETLLDHQTFLETKLDDKFFGGMSLSYRFPALRKDNILLRKLV
jgi:hypothetical protein